MSIKYSELRMFSRPEMTVRSLLKNNISEVYEDKERYYVLIKTSDQYANENYIINKDDNSISWVHFVDLIAAGIFDEATEISPEELKRALA